MSSGAAAAVTIGRCNPYGGETGGPRRVLGGLYGPGSAATPGMDLPLAVEQGEWLCGQPAQVRCRMVCRCGHKGQVMQLCSWHDETTFSGERVSGTFRQVKGTVRVRGHFEEIQRRQSESCPRCLFPAHGSTDYAQLMKEWQRKSGDLQVLYEAGLWRTLIAEQTRQAITAIGDKMDEARRLGIIHNCPMTLEVIS